MNLRRGFLQALEENEDDLTTRLVYADWLEERGEDEEAERMRRWPAAKGWLVKFCDRYNGFTRWGQEYPETVREDAEEYYPDIHYARLVELGRKAVAEREPHGLILYCGANESMSRALGKHSFQFWENWSIVTGIPIEEKDREKSCFSCGC